MRRYQGFTEFGCGDTRKLLRNQTRTLCAISDRLADTRRPAACSADTEEAA